ncbi:hypothetical protein PAXINDRAFT_180906 [Paxillus involutus ATCC 200175]|uniref:DNA mismatch repair proteins mutS family domain-containing protein n=1 Tax=Paxillus involutus ATCC 200175 TaxID=664439 RepID=A0A0C9SY11_PAXIN|nr:hypothetical protein PAXINDRAFT_180906 [Paxillus involutus ATCC 200175]
MAPPKVPEKQKSTENMKQKSLMNFFGKPPDTKSSKPSGPTVFKSTSATKQMRTPESKTTSSRLVTSSVTRSSRSSDVEGSVRDTPPTSDPIDVDMLSAEEVNSSTKKTTTRPKRKLLIADSDDDGEAGVTAVNKSTKAVYRTSSPEYYDRSSPSRRGRTKKPRVSVLSSDEEEVNVSAFSSRLSRFKKSPAKSSHKSRSSSVADDDDFIVADESDDEPKGRSSSRASSRSSTSNRSSGRSTDHNDDEDEDDDPKPKKAPAKRAALKKVAAEASNTSGGSSLFLTAAEQRTQEKKTEKKAAEDPFSFLVNVKDKDGVHPGQPGYDPRTLYIPEKAWIQFTPFEKQFWEIKQNHFDTLYEEDARVGHREFDLKLTQRVKMSMVYGYSLDAVQELINHATFEEAFTSLVKGLPDLERIVSRIHANNCKVKDFIKVLSAFKKLDAGLASLAENSESFESKTILGLLRSAPDLTPHLNNVKSRFTIDKETEELLPVDGKDEVYDEVVEEISTLEKGLDSQLKKFEKKVGCSLSWWHSGVGNKEIYLVQTKANETNIPDDWVKSSATKAAKRWVVPSLQASIRSLKEARENRNTAIKEFKGRLYAEFDADRGVWLRAVRVLAELDFLGCDRGPSCRPEFVEGDAAFIEFEELRHPTLAGLRESFIPNDVKLGGDVGRIALLTGPNMGGKSTAMRMTATGVIMAQLGMLVPAKSARLCPVDAILTRMGAYDNMFSNASTFKVELDECCKILRNATPKSLVILDELGRGTSTYDGMAIAGAVLHELATHTLPLTFFATHYGSLTDDFAYHPNIRNMHMSTHLDDEKQELVFLYKLVGGVASSSFGTHVASLAGVPSDVVSRAEVVSEDFAKQFKARIDGQKKHLASKLPLVAQADFKYLLALAKGEAKLPDDLYKQRELLKGLKAAVKAYLR